MMTIIQTVMHLKEPIEDNNNDLVKCIRPSPLSQVVKIRGKLCCHPKPEWTLEVVVVIVKEEGAYL